ncbi:Kinase-like protein, related [Eimeria tenella]|uniref:Kinase-like protein, related n=1 Tax=Eimeria tenella TaxID=5802 RepID=U6L6I6_EIMTE|nr:Kinase-like protein, related [Eimeria tenella]CDJ44204.1 Kinase-like protein, related [Eimeria tenella]|eukprot:XP_013234953.1 Kinase-like protein, related [Eimeria tenella]
MPDVLIVTAASTGLLLRDVPHISRFVEVLPAYPSAASPGAFAPRATGAATVEESAAAAAEAAKFLPEMTKEDLTTAAMSARQSCCGQWLVFANEGVCLTHLFFVADKGGSGLLEPNALWWYLKASARIRPPPSHVRHFAAAAVAAAATDVPFFPLLLQLRESGSELLLVIREVLQQLLLALRETHKRQITHRDIKLENVLLRPSLPLAVRLVDWGSAVTNDTASPLALALKALWGEEAPSILEESDGYQPPEVWAQAAAQAELKASLHKQRYYHDQQEKQHCDGDCSASNGSQNGGNGNISNGHNNNGAGSKYTNSSDNNNSKTKADRDLLHRPPSHDMWGVGMIFLKLVLGTPSPLEPIDDRRRAKLSQAYQGKPPEVLRHDLQILALSDLCLIPWASDRLPAAASPTAVATTSQSFAFASLKSAVVTAAESFYLNWLAPYREKATSTEHHSKELLQGDVEKVETQEKKKKKEKGLDRDGLLALISRVRGFAEGSELVLRQQQQALQRQQTAGLFSLDQDDDDAQYLFTQKGQTAQNRQQYRECDEALFAEILRFRDPAGVGVPNPLARDLLRKLLAFDPQERLSAEAALQHPWFSVSAAAAGAVNEQHISQPP